MRIVRLQAEGFKRLVAVDITPEGELVTVRGNNAEGKSSVLDAIFAALGGAAAAPVKPVRTGEEYAIIKLDLGDLKVTRYFGDDGADRLKVENAEGAVYSSGQTMLDRLVGKIAFDPLAFARMDDKAQAAELRRLVPLKVDLDELARLDKADYDARRDVNRDGKAVKARIDAIVIPEGELGERPDREKLANALAEAADTNTAIERERTARGTKAGSANAAEERAQNARVRADRLRSEADEMDKAADAETKFAADIRAELEALPPLAEPVDVSALREEIAKADRLAEVYRRRDERDRLKVEFEGLKAKSEGLTGAMEKRAKERDEALAAAEMPVDGLSFAKLGDSDDLIVTYQGEPFSQASGAQQLRVSAAIAMASNPKLRVMIVKDGSLLDPTGVELLRDIAKAGDFQIWMEAVGEGDGVGIIMEGGKVKGAPDPERVEAPKRRKPKADGDGEAKDREAELSRANSPIPGDMAQTAHPEPETPARPKRKATAMREFNTRPGGLFGEE